MKIISEIGDNLVADRRNKTGRYEYRKDLYQMAIDWIPVVGDWSGNEKT